MPRSCPACATANPDEARFCMACGAELTATSARAEERRLVTILFADLVGFTERSDHADPEDVRRTLIPFHRAAKEAIEAYGGVLDKFIGDAAMGVFGAPVAHDDDPVRAVRAGLELLSRVSDIQASVDTAASIRVAVNTGEAVVTFGSGPQVGEAVAGDVVNTASRMQSLAPAGGLVIGERSWEATRDVFDAEAAEPVLVKGKSEPLRVWRVLREREAPLAQTPMIGREADLRALREALDAAAGGEGRRIVTVVAEPGSGKTRLLEEFRLRSMADGITWHEAAFAPYGQQSPFRPLADLVASAAGLGSISTSGFAALGPAIDAAASDLDDASWLRARLAPIFGEDRSTDGTPDTPADTAVAVARLLRSAAGDTLVFALEDVHWAEPSVRAVVRMVADALEGVPALLVCTARPELLEDDDAAPWNVQMLAPLTREDTAAIVIGLVERDALASTVVDAIAERASGNPLFAVEFARGLSSGGADVGSVPTSVRGVIGARLDTLPVAARAVALDASVLGTVFWPSALDALADEPGEVEGAVATLLDRGIVMPREGGPVAGHATFAFRHALLQEEAYGRLARPVRARKHLAAGRWLEGAGSPETPPPASMVAWHLERALTLAEAAGEGAVAEEARGPAIAWLVRAGDELWRLDPTSAFDLYARAEELGPPDELADAVLLGVGLTGRRSGRLDSAGVLERYERGLTLARERSDPTRIGSWLTRVGSQCGVMGDSARAVACYDEAIALLEPMPPARPLAAALAYRAEEDMMAGRSAASLERVERSLPIAREHEQDDLVIMNLHLRGDARCSLGDLAGVDDLEEALQLARRSAGASDIVTSLTYVGDWMWQLEGCRASLSSFEEGLALAHERGAVSQGRWTEMHLALIYEELGAWDRALDLARALLSIDAGQLDATLAAVAAVTLSTILLRRRGNERAWDPAEVLHAAEGSHELQALAPAYGYAVEAAAARGDTEATVAAIDALLERTADAIVAYRAGEAPCVVRSAVAVGAPGPAAALVATLGDPPIPRDRLHRDAAVAALAEAAGDVEAAATGYADVAARWKDYGHAWEEAQAWAGLARAERLREHGTEAAAARARAERIFSELRVPTQG